MKTLYLASTSPRRRELLAQIGVKFDLLHVDLDESRLPGEAPADYVRRLALEKARAGYAGLGPAQHPAAVLGADTSVVLGDTLFGKPADPAEARATLRSLAGRSHQVLTGVALCDGGERVELCSSRVWFADLSESELAAYIASHEPYDKAGGYAIQGLAARFISRLEGSYSGVMGLPLYETARLLGAAGLL